MYGHYMPTDILIIIGIPSLNHSFIAGLNLPFLLPPQPLLFFFRIHYVDSPDCLLLLLSIIRLLLFSFPVFALFSCRFRAGFVSCKKKYRNAKNMASAGARAYMGVWGRCPQRGPGAEPLVRGKVKAFYCRREQICHSHLSET